ncbi:MAG: hypothetical protein FWE36_03100 [Erysipelotrichales bacterium]|nr:hypothetical protein [Erysipelotrichales bacterium]
MPAKTDKYRKVPLTGATIFYLIVTAVIVVGISLLLIPNQQERIFRRYRDANVGGGETLQRDHNLRQVSVNRLLRVIDNAAPGERIIVYFGSEDCSACRARVRNVVQLSQDRGVERIYYLRDRNINLLPLEDRFNLPMGEVTPEVWVFMDGEMILSSRERRFLNDDQPVRSTMWETFLRNYVFNPQHFN